jgi:hypothetical protein
LLAGSAEAAPSESVAAKALSNSARARASADAELARKGVDVVPDEKLHLYADVLIETRGSLGRPGKGHGAKRALKDATALDERNAIPAGIALIRG